MTIDAVGEWLSGGCWDRVVVESNQSFLPCLSACLPACLLGAPFVNRLTYQLEELESLRYICVRALVCLPVCVCVCVCGSDASAGGVCVRTFSFAVFRAVTCLVPAICCSSFAITGVVPSSWVCPR
eukprot:GHVU01021135.1.p2 GENE.GHVU01021135.1~~GHVU01021135.1.p2  ORF type:complete len:126 (+),score=2.95 GHVU01021135.1:25-402(+)